MQLPVDVESEGNGKEREQATEGVRDRYQTIADLAFGHVRDAVIRGDLSPGDKVNQEEIATRLGISRMPVREALRRLEERGFVTIEPHRGAFVTEISTEHVREVYEVRRVLEAANAAEAARRMDDERISRLATILEQAGAAADAGDRVALSELNRDFHLVGHEASGNRTMNQIISDLTLHSQRYRLLHASLPVRAHMAHDEHERILEAWRAHDPERASHWIEINLSNSEAALLAAIDATAGKGTD